MPHRTPLLIFVLVVLFQTAHSKEHIILSSTDHLQGTQLLRSSPLKTMLTPAKGDLLTGLPDANGAQPSMANQEVAQAETASQFVHPSTQQQPIEQNNANTDRGASNNANTDQSSNKLGTKFNRAGAATTTNEKPRKFKQRASNKLDTKFNRAGTTLTTNEPKPSAGHSALVQKFKPAKFLPLLHPTLLGRLKQILANKVTGINFVPFSQAWRDDCKARADNSAGALEAFDPTKNKQVAEKFEQELTIVDLTLDDYNDDYNPGTPDDQSFGIVRAAVPPMEKRKKILEKIQQLSGRFVEGTMVKFNQFKYALRCKPWKTLTVSASVGLMVAAAVFPPVAGTLATVGLVYAGLMAVVDAADEPCLAGAGVIFVRTVVVQGALALVSLPGLTENVPAADWWDASDETLAILENSGGALDIVGQEVLPTFHAFKCSCGTVVNGKCEPTDGPSNPLFRLKERAKKMFPGRYTAADTHDRQPGHYRTDAVETFNQADYGNQPQVAAAHDPTVDVWGQQVAAEDLNFHPRGR